LLLPNVHANCHPQQENKWQQVLSELIAPAADPVLPFYLPHHALTAILISAKSAPLKLREQDTVVATNAFARREHTLHLFLCLKIPVAIAIVLNPGHDGELGRRMPERFDPKVSKT